MANWEDQNVHKHALWSIKYHPDSKMLLESFTL